MHDTTLPTKVGFSKSHSRIVTVRTTATDDGVQDICLQTRSSAMGGLIGAAHRAAGAPVIVLLTGERGVGKKTLARQMHEWSAWRGHPFVVVDCAALSPMLQTASFEEALVSLARSCGVWDPRAGRIGQSTILLDNVADLCALGQCRFLQFLEENAPCTKPGGYAAGGSFRLMAASNRSLAAEVGANRFRQELFFRINVINLEIPPLRERPEDILPLAEHMLRHPSRRRGSSPMHFSPDAVAALARYRWPGNLGELRNAVEHAAVLAKGAPAVTVRHLPRTITAGRAVPDVDDSHPLTSLEEVERQHIARVLSETQSFEKAAATLGIHLTTLWRKRRRYNLMSPPAKSNTV
jgi:two-component system, NtrC family, response regulator AlgB